MSFEISFDNLGIYDEMATPVSAIGFPEVLDYHSAYAHIAELAESEVLIGVQGDGKALTVDFDRHSPHILVSAGTGGGKSVTTRQIVASAVHRGASSVILDIKQNSHRWAYNVPGISYARTATEIGYALIELGKEVHKRNAIIADHNGPVETAPVGARIVVGFEEINATMTQLTSLDKRLPAGAYTAKQAFADILLLGRSAKVNVVGVIQSPDYRIIPQALIEQFNARVMIRFTKQTWTKIAWDAGLPQAAPAEIGRGLVVYGGKARETQIAYLTEDEARGLALARRS